MKQDGKIDYIELPGGDLPATKAFYAETFGWRFTDWGPAYAAFDEGLDGGFQADVSAGLKAPLVVLYASDLEAMHAKVIAGGAQITQDIFAFPGGRRFHFSDPAGNELAVVAYAAE